MCGIVAYIGSKNIFEFVMFGLQMLQNRGYDSAGICAIDKQNQFITRKYISTKEESAIEKLGTIESAFEGCSIACAHSRWCTTGIVSKENSHPHNDYTNKITLVHNGIIENYTKLKEDLINEHQIPFLSQTDSEVIVNLIGFYYEQYSNIEKAIVKAISLLEGTWGLVIMCTDEPNKLYCARHGSPLLIGFGEDYVMIASEQSGFCKYVNNYICLNNHDLAILKKENGKIVFEELDNYDIKGVTLNKDEMSAQPFANWTLKEIYEQPESAARAIGMGGRITNEDGVKLGGLDIYKTELLDVRNLILLGCGTSYHAGLHCLNIFKKISGFATVQIFDGAEFSKYDIPNDSKKTAVLLLSQSGETSDLHRCIGIAEENNLIMIGVVNVVDSLIARETQCGVYLNAGREVGVASTKSFTSQVIVLNMIAVWFAQNRNISLQKRKKIIEGLRRLRIDIGTTINKNHDTCKLVAKEIVHNAKQTKNTNNSLFILGKGACEAIAKEGALKIKEITYVHAEGYSSSSLKHGPFAILEEKTPVILVIPNDDNIGKNDNAASEIKSRNGFTIGITDGTLHRNNFDIIVEVEKNKEFVGLLSTIILQLIAYEIAILKGHSPDRPKNLAKCISVN